MLDPELHNLKALSIRQPWAWAILNAGKDVENRDWSERYQGLRDARTLIGRDFLIHASAGMTRNDYEDFIDTAHTISRTHPFPAGTVVPPMRDLPRGGIVGIATMHSIVFDRYESPWFFGPVGLVLRNVRPLSFVACKGALGFFRPEIVNG